MDRRLALDNGRRVKTVEPNGTITHYPFPFYEVENPGQPGEVKRVTYSLGGQAIALRITGGSNPGLYYVHADHLGSTSQLTNSSGGLAAGTTARYLPFGKYRVTPTAGLTDRGFTGHLHNDPVGLVYMNARYYVPGVGRFASADTIVPDPADPQSYNRYAYAYNNPVNFSDPSGHNPAWCNDPYDSGGGADCASLVDFTVADGAEVTWTYAEESEIRWAAALIDFKLMRHGSSFLEVYGGTVTFQKTGEEKWNLGFTENQNLVKVNEQKDGATVTSLGGTWVAHELAHVFDKGLVPNTTDDLQFGQATIDLATSDLRYANARGVQVQIAGGCNTGNYLTSCYIRNDAGYVEQHNTSPSPMEDFADMFSGYIYGFASGNAGQARYDWMDSHMSAWISLAVTNNHR